MSTPLIVYLCVVCAIGLALSIRVWFWLERTTARRLERIGKKKRFEAVRTQSPVENPAELARDRALLSIETQFTVTRRLLVPLILVATGLALGIPFLQTIPASAVTLVLGAVTVLGGVAARPLLENAFAGLVISMSKQVNIGDTVSIEGRYGTVEDISSTHTTVKLWDWRRYLVPNSKMLQLPLINYSLVDRFVWAHVEFYVPNQTDLDLVRELAISAARGSRHFVDHEDPKFWVMDLGQDAIKCWLAAWADTPSDAWALAHDARSSLVLGFREHGIQGRVVVYKAEASPMECPVPEGTMSPGTVPQGTGPASP